MESLKTMELQTVLCPLWADAKTCKTLFGLPHPTLKRLADTGEIRRKKTGESAQAGALYKVADLCDWMES